MLRRPKVPSDTNTKLPFPFPSHSCSQSPTCSHLLRKSLEKLMTCKSEVGDWLGGFCQPFKAGERTSHMVRNMRLLDFSLQVCFFVLFCFLGVWLEEGFVKLKPWCIEEASLEHKVSGSCLGMTLLPCISMQTPSGKPLTCWSLTAFPLSREDYWLTKPLPGLTATTTIYCSVLHFNVTTAWSIRGKPRLLVDREPVEISSIEF